ncbi:MAG: diaminopimelate epimerase [Nitrospirae bacterium]|nr:diaminopimelate epimerase [Nitrospirota bacterium]
MYFTKMHGLGNDFILIDCIKQPEAGGLLFETISKKLCDRRFGIGADQILLLYPSAAADFKMRIFNADGGEVEMCGNGMRCFAKYIWDRGLSTKDTLTIETLAGIVKPERAGESVKVDMGQPILEPEKIPVAIISSGKSVNPIIDYPLKIKDREFKMTCVSMGNPHAVIFLNENISDFPVSEYGAVIEHHPLFPKRTNVEFVNVQSKSEVSMRVWERGSGETLACGTGASAAGVASMLKGLTGRKVIMHLKGGDLEIEWAQNNHVYMTGPAVEAFEGKFKTSADRKKEK